MEEYIHFELQNTCLFCRKIQRAHCNISNMKDEIGIPSQHLLCHLLGREMSPACTRGHLRWQSEGHALRMHLMPLSKISRHNRTCMRHKTFCCPLEGKFFRELLHGIIELTSHYHNFHSRIIFASTTGLLRGSDMKGEHKGMYPGDLAALWVDSPISP